MNTGALYTEIIYGKAFVYHCTVLDFKPGKVKIRYVKPPAMMNTAIVKWVSNDDISIYVH